MAEKITLSVETARKLHREGKQMQLHSAGKFDNGVLKAAVFGANDGIVTTFAVVAGVAGAQLSPAIVLVMGLANMFADGLSMGLGDYLGERSEARHRARQYEIEKWEIAYIPEEELIELDRYFQKKEINEGDRKQLTNILRKYPKFWAELGFIDEMGMTPQIDRQLWLSGAVTFFAFLGAGFLPLTPYVLFYLGAPLAPEHQFTYSMIATTLALFCVGSLRTYITKGAWWKNGLEMLGIGTIAAATAYVLGALIANVV
ncbi:TPA: hypothetical protein DIV55_03845 [Patescibacteria group bacterium]|uniref:Integral membrane protein n=1 Tax=Candidatus Gottesmanbacteria bacterium GW2011_GWA1_43_11 TaxID=1618436 RepID=A0A0G1ER09_9BACT|nr:MAG: hypothetical protein UV59_C0007G0069 [Candidatus Gottesmanbacteria bacterium GW2011_GWA1_43_11]HCS78852.1 hypothetical protein [Patescibacteria group bacterium]